MRAAGARINGSRKPAGYVLAAPDETDQEAHGRPTSDGLVDELREPIGALEVGREAFRPAGLVEAATGGAFDDRDELVERRAVVLLLVMLNFSTINTINRTLTACARERDDVGERLVGGPKRFGPQAAALPIPAASSSASTAAASLGRSSIRIARPLRVGRSSSFSSAK